MTDLSPRQRECLALIAEGLTDREIAQRLGPRVTYRTGNHHGITICVQGNGGRCGREHHDCDRGHLVAVVVDGGGDESAEELAERICRLLNADEREARRKPTDCPRCGADKPLMPGGVCLACAEDMAREDA